MAAVIRGRWRIGIHSLRPRLLTRIVTRRMIFVVDAATRRDREQPESETKTLGDLLYTNKANFSVSEKDWVRLVQAIAAGDQLALHSLYEQTHRIVFTLIVRITNNRETAEELTIDVFYDVWRRASAYDPAGGSVVGWIMNQARSRAIDRLRFENRKKESTLIRRILCFAKIPCALKIVRFPATMAASSRSSLHPRTPRICPGEPERYTCIYKDGGTRTSSRRCVGSD